MADMLAYEFMQRAFIAALLVGLAAPMVGVFLVQRRLSLIGDGMGHMALAGVALGVITGTQPILTALVTSVVSAVLIEVVRSRGHANADVALAVMFYGGIALGVFLLSTSGAGAAGLTSYLFGAITTTSPSDVAVFAVLAVVVIAATWLLRSRFFAVANDEEWSRATGLPVTALNVLLTVLTAVTVVVAMRVIGLLLISALMIVPNAAAQQVARSFRGATLIAVLIGVVCSVGGVAASYQFDSPSGPTIVLLAIGVFVALAIGSAVRAGVAARHHRYAETHAHVHGPGCGHQGVPHGDHTDYLHDGHRHAIHGDHYDEHASHDTEFTGRESSHHHG